MSALEKFVEGVEPASLVPVPSASALTREDVEHYLYTKASPDERATFLDAIMGLRGAEVFKASERELIVREARRLADSRELAEGDVWREPLSLPISDFLAVEPDAPSFHVEGLWPHGGLVLLNAAKKWGKSTMVRHLTESVLTGTPFLRQFEISSPFEKALVIDCELSERQAWDMWTGTPLTGDQMVLWRLRESLSTLRFREPVVRKEVTSRIADLGVDLLVLDPLGPVLRVNTWEENSNTDVGSCLDLLVEMCADAGVTGIFLPHHTGHSGTNARGASVLGDKADAIWSGALTNASDPYGARTLGAIGRSGVSQHPVQLSFDPATRLPYLDEFAASGLVSSEEIAAAKALEVQGAVLEAISAGRTSKTGVRQAVRAAGIKASNDVIDGAYEAHKNPAGPAGHVPGLPAALPPLPHL
jgi:hypothetical protein